MTKLRPRDREFQSLGQASQACGVPIKPLNNNDISIFITLVEHQTTFQACSFLTAAFDSQKSPERMAVLELSIPVQQKGNSGSVRGKGTDTLQIPYDLTCKWNLVNKTN